MNIENVDKETLKSVVTEVLIENPKFFKSIFLPISLRRKIYPLLILYIQENAKVKAFPEHRYDYLELSFSGNNFDSHDLERLS